MADLTQDDVNNILDGGDPPAGGNDGNSGGENPQVGGENPAAGTGGEERAGTGEGEGKGKSADPATAGQDDKAGKESDEFADLEDLEDFDAPPAPKGGKREPEEAPEGEDPSIGIVTPQESVDLFRAVKAKFPDVVKEFPAVRTAIFKSGQYEQFFPTVKDAAEAIAVTGVYNEMERQVSQGNLKPIFNALKKNAPDAMKVVAETLMESLGDRELQNIAAEPVVRELLKAALEEGETTNNKNLMLAAKYLISYAYGTKGGTLPPPRSRAATPGAANDPLAAERQALRQREEAIAMRDFVAVQTQIGAGVESSIKQYINKHIDPEKKLNDFTRDAAVNSVYNELVDKLGKNTTHVRNITALWNQIRQNPQNAATVGAAIRRAIAASAKPYLPTLISEKRAKALGIVTGKGQPKAAGGRNLPGGGSGGNAGTGGTGKSVSLNGVKSKDIDFDKTSEDDILDGKVKLRQ